MLIRLAGLVAALALAATSSFALAGSASAAPTCSEELGIDNHGVHITRDYVIGEDGTGPAHEGAEIPGGPGPGFHFEHGFAPGASFCNDQAQSPGIHF